MEQHINNVKHRKESKPGDLIQIPFNKAGVHTYARTLKDGSCMIYDSPSTVERSDFDNIINSEYLFICHQNGYAIIQGLWPILANLPLGPRLEEFRPRYFNPNPADESNFIFYNLNRAEIEEAIQKDWIKTDIQLNGTHDMVHVEARISDYYEGRMN